MATFVNTTQPAQTSGPDNSMTFILGAVVAILVIVLLFVFGRGYFRGSSGNSAPSTTTNTTNITPPAGNTSQSAPQVNVPDKIDVNVNPSP